MKTFFACLPLLYHAFTYAAPPSQELEIGLQKILPGSAITAISETPIQGIFQISTDSKILYTDASGRYLFYGHLIDLHANEPKSLTEESLKAVRKASLSNIDGKSTIVFSSKDKETKHTITVFTDIDCGYCRKFHQEVPALNDAGIAVRYFSFPRAGVDSESFKKAVDVWCAKNPEKALTEAKAGKTVERTPGCDKSDVIKAHLDLVRSLELRATPIIFLEDGTEIPGYVPADSLIAKVNG